VSAVQELDRSELEAVLGLADGSVPAERASELPAGREELVARHALVVQALRAAGPEPTPAVRHRLVADMPAARSRPWRGFQPLAVAGATLAVVIAILAVGLSWLSGPAPTVLAVANLGLKGVVQSPPAPVRDKPQLLDRSFAGVSFPNWGEDLVNVDEHGVRDNWTARGARTDTIDGRKTLTVIYGHTHHRLAYTVVDGDPLDPPANARRMVVNGVELYLLRLSDGRYVATFERDSRTCVIAGHAMTVDTVLRAATWKGGGAVRF
jgi:hypothetical protein